MISIFKSALPPICHDMPTIYDYDILYTEYILYMLYIYIIECRRKISLIHLQILIFIFLAYFQYAYVRALSEVRLRYYFPWGWPILLVSGSIDSLWPKDLSDGRIFFGTGRSPQGRVWSPFSLTFHMSHIILGCIFESHFGSHILKVYKCTKHDLRHS
jgi:hypothetical protein